MEKVVVKPSMDVTIHNDTVETLDNENIREIMQDNEGSIYIPYHASILMQKKTERAEEEVTDDFCKDIPAPEDNDCISEDDEPQIFGVEDKTIHQGVGIDLKHGVRAEYRSSTIEYTVSPETIDKCDVGEHEVTYSASADGKETTVTRKITISAINDPTITGLEDLHIHVGEEFDPLENVHAVDGNGNHVDVTVGDSECQYREIINVAEYTAPSNTPTDECGNETIATRNIVVESEPVSELVLFDKTFTLDVATKSITDVVNNIPIAVGDRITLHVVGIDNDIDYTDNAVIGDYGTLVDGENYVYNGFGNFYLTANDGVCTSSRYQNTDLQQGFTFHLKVIKEK